MQNAVNRRWLLKSYPEGMPSLENWTMDSQSVPDPGAGHILVKAKWLSVDPCARPHESSHQLYEGETVPISSRAISGVPIARKVYCRNGLAMAAAPKPRIRNLSTKAYNRFASNQSTATNKAAAIEPIIII
jgi:hypothetical protein